MRNLTLPAAFKSVSWSVSVAGHTRGAPTREGAGVYARGSGARIVGQFVAAPMATAEALAVRAFFHRLRGRAGTFFAPIPGTGTITGTATVDTTAAAGASSVVLTGVSGLTIAPGMWAVIGDLTAGGQMVRVVSVSGSTIDVRPRLRAAQASTTAVTFGRVSGLFRLSDRVPMISMRNGRSAGFTVEFEEAR